MIGRRAWLRLAALASLATLTSCDKKIKEEDPLTSKWLEGMKTYAVGRHLIDIPAAFRMDGGHVVLTYGLTSEFTTVDVTLNSMSASEATFNDRVSRRASEFAQEMHDKLPNTSMLAATIKLSPKAVILRKYRSSLSTDSFHSELIALVGSVLVTCWQDSYSEDPIAATRRLTQLSGQLIDTSLVDSPSRGFQLGPLLIVSEHDQESGSAFFKSGSDVSIELHVDAISPNPLPSLVQRWSSAPWDPSTMGPKPETLRKGPTRVADMDGEELLTKAKMNGRLVMKLSAESKRPKPGFASPTLTLELDTEPQGASENVKTTPWTESDTLEVWEAVLKSLRLRPGAV